MVIDAADLSKEMKEFVIEVFLDANRAYERVCHAQLQMELLKTNIPLSAVALIMNFVRMRKTRVRVRIGETCFISSKRTF